MFRSRGHAENIGSAGLDIDHEAIIEAYARQDYDAAIALIPREAASVFGIAGTPKQCRARLEEYESFGLDELVVGMSGDPVADRLTLDILRDHIRRAS
jgi:alkanesulfonate monooxygenase SsuD/methylene tetrahydromethanopterin reductase-like flavin-dependent oxidoreductase (luciferase family)